MTASRIHPTAIIEAGAKLADDVSIGAYSVIGSNVSIGAATVVGPHVVLTGRMSIGARNRFFQFTSIGEIPQDRKYGGEATSTTIGDDNVFREFVTVHAGTAQDRGDTLIGNGNLFLAYTHIAHDCVVGNYTVFSNNAQIAGHVHVDDWAVLGAFVGVHQFARIGAHAMLAGGAMVRQDVPPFVIAAGYPARPYSVNSEGLRRRGFSDADIASVRRAYKILYRDGHGLDDARVVLAQEALAHPVVKPLADFVAEPGRGIIR